MPANIGEETPLLYTLELAEDENIGVTFKESALDVYLPDDSLPLETEKSSSWQTSLNIAKMCMGTGTLALPFGAGEGGLVFNIIGLAFITLWNIYCVDRLVKCLYYIEENKIYNVSKSRGHRKTSSLRRRMFKKMDSSRIRIDEEMVKDTSLLISNVESPPQNTNTFGQVSWYAFGNVGLWFLDTIMLMLMFGILIAYQGAIIGFIKNTPLTMGSSLIDSLMSLIVIIPICSVTNLQSVAKFSAFGIIFMLGTFFVIAGYGINEYGLAGFSLISEEHLWPKDLTAASNWFGVAAFGYGVVPFTYNIRESMSKPELMNHATQNALWLVFATYIILSNLIPIIFLPGVQKIDGDVLEILPLGWIPTIVRLSMTLVVAVTFPLIVVPAGELVEGKLGVDFNSKHILRVVLRSVLIILCGFVSVFVPSFVHIISFLGCVSVSVISFICPPVFHLVLLCRWRHMQKSISSANQNTFKLHQGGAEEIDESDSTSKQPLAKDILMDVILITWGVVACIITSILTFKSLLKQMQ